MPRRKKSFSVHKRSRSAPASLCRPGSRSGKRKQCSEENMAAALQSVEQGSSVTPEHRETSGFLEVLSTIESVGVSFMV